ncbi:MAG TPA: hypothetical protein V6C91_00550 [Coleofasciculaceae cyanobacterium]
MGNIKTLHTSKSYLISGKPGMWHFSRSKGTKFLFWRFAINDPNRQITTSLTEEQVKSWVWEEIPVINFSKLEAFAE